MRARKNLKHMGRSGAEKRAYLDSVESHGPTVPVSQNIESDLPVDTASSGTIGELERLSNKESDHSSSTKPYRSFKTQLSVAIAEHLISILGTVILIFISVFGYLFLKQNDSNREIGEIKVTSQDAQRQLSDLQKNYQDLGKQQSEFDKTIALIQQAIGFYTKK
jgi:hypothetical protein